MRVLVTAASRHGSTAEIARLIAGHLTDAGMDVTVLPPEQVRDVTGYDGFVVGSAVYFGRWMGSAKEFVARFGPALAGRPVWLYSSGPVVGDPPQPSPDDLADVPALLAATGAREHRMVAGRVDRSHLGFGEKLAVAAARARDGDYRPLSEINEWADGIARSLRLGAPAAV